MEEMLWSGGAERKQQRRSGENNNKFQVHLTLQFTSALEISGSC